MHAQKTSPSRAVASEQCGYVCVAGKSSLAHIFDCFFDIRAFLIAQLVRGFLKTIHLLEHVSSHLLPIERPALHGFERLLQSFRKLAHGFTDIEVQTSYISGAFTVSCAIAVTFGYVMALIRQ